MGIGIAFFTEAVGAGPRKDMDILGLGMADGCELRVHPTGKAVVRLSRQDARARDTRRRSPRSSPRNSASRPTTSTWCTVTPTRRRSDWAPTAAGRRRCRVRPPHWWRARSATRPGSSRRGCWRCRSPTSSGRRAASTSRAIPVPSVTIQDIAMRAHGAGDLPEGIEGGLDAQICYNPENLTYPYGAYICVVDVDPGTGSGQGAAVHRRRRLRHPDQPDDHRGPGARRAGRRHRHGADGDDRVRRGRQLPRRLVDGLPDPDRAGGPALGDRATPSRRRRTTRSAPRASASRPPSARRRRWSTRWSTRWRRSAFGTPTCRSPRRGCGRRCRAGRRRRSRRSADEHPTDAHRQLRAVADAVRARHRGARRSSRPPRSPATRRSCSPTARSRASSAGSARRTRCAPPRWAR